MPPHPGIWSERVRSLFAIVLLLAIGTSVSLASPVKQDEIAIDLEVFQGLRAGVAGVGFENDYARVGLPFPQGMVRVVNGRAELAVAGRDYQTQVLKKWPDGSARWALVEFLTTVPAEGVSRERLVRGPGASAGSNLAVEKNGRIVVDTGPLQVEIRGKGFNLFDRVTVDGRNIVRQGESRGIVLRTADGRDYSASGDPAVRVAVEENGPIKAVVRVDGAHVNGSDAKLDYTMRLFFVKGKRSVSAQYTLRNASKRSPQHAFIASLDLHTKAALSGDRVVSVSTHKGVETIGSPKEKVVFYQAVSDFPWKSDGDAFYYKGPVAPHPTKKDLNTYAQEGYWIWHGKEMLRRGGRGEFPEYGGLSVHSKQGGGLLAGVRYMAGTWPKALRAEPDGSVVVSLWPEESKKDHAIRFGSHTSFEILYEFDGGSTGYSPAAAARFQYPLVCRAPVSWYNANARGIYPLSHFVSFKDEYRLSERLGVKNKVSGRTPRFSVWRYHYWGHGGYLNQHDFSRVSLLNFLRDDRAARTAGEWFLTAESMVNYYTDWAVFHSDDYDYSKQAFEALKYDDLASLPKVLFEWEHQHWYGMPLYYYMTGDRRVADALQDLGEQVKRGANPLSKTYMRVFGCGMFSLAALYDHFGDKEYLKLADMNFRRLLDARLNPDNPFETIFIDWKRGYVAGGSGNGWPGVKADLMLGSILYDGILNYYLVGSENPELRGKARELLEAISRFMEREAYFEGTKYGQWAFWIPYQYNLQDRSASDHGYRLVGQASFWPLFPFMETGRDMRLDQMRKMMKMVLSDTDGLWGSFGYADHPGYQAMAYYLLESYR